MSLPTTFLYKATSDCAHDVANHETACSGRNTGIIYFCSAAEKLVICQSDMHSSYMMDTAGQSNSVCTTKISSILSWRNDCAKNSRPSCFNTGGNPQQKHRLL